MQLLKSALIVGAIATTHSSLALSKDCVSDDDKIVCGILVKLEDSTTPAGCKVDAPDVKVKRDKVGHDIKPNLLMFYLVDNTSLPAGTLLFQKGSVKLKTGTSGGVPSVHFDDQLVRDGRRTYLLLDKNLNDDDFKYWVEIWNPQTKKNCDYVDPTIHNTN